MHVPGGIENLNHCAFLEAVKPERIADQRTGGRKEDRNVQAELSSMSEG
jgi:hypothetical protein